jgi:hypothetical protein
MYCLKRIQPPLGGWPNLRGSLFLADAAAFFADCPNVKIMDRLSAWEIVEEVCGLAGTVARVFKTLYDYYQNVKNAPEQSQELQDELYEISHIARNMKMLVAKSGRRGREKIVKDVTVVHFEKMLDEIEKKITLPEGSITLQRLKWPFSQKENGEYIARIERFKTTLNLALSVYQRYHCLPNQTYFVLQPASRRYARNATHPANYRSRYKSDNSTNPQKYCR